MRMSGSVTAEQILRETLRAHLPHDEPLLALSSGYLRHFRRRVNRHMVIGLTPKRLLLVQTRTQHPISIWRNKIQAINWQGRRGLMEVVLESTSFVIRITGNEFTFRAANIKHTHDRTPSPFEKELPAAQDLILADGLSRLGFVQEALVAYDRVPVTQTDLEPESELGELSRSIFDVLFSIRAATLMLIVLAIANVYMMLSYGWNQPILNFLIFFDLVVAYHLWHGRTRPWAPLALVRWVVGTLCYTVIMFSNGDFYAVIAQSFITVALILTLTGEKNRLRTLAAIGVFLAAFQVPLFIAATLKLM